MTVLLRGVLNFLIALSLTCGSLPRDTAFPIEAYANPSTAGSGTRAERGSDLGSERAPRPALAAALAAGHTSFTRRAGEAGGDGRTVSAASAARPAGGRGPSAAPSPDLLGAGSCGDLPRLGYTGSHTGSEQLNPSVATGRGLPQPRAPPSA